tara:strand:- start:5347 stop:5565 length:219 start_codon:yes stop_codon:yes gene_type:complete
MSIRQNIAEAAQKLKQEKGLSYEDICGNGGVTRKQVSAILHGKKGVSLELIERVFKEVFEEELIVCLLTDLG